MNLTAEVAEKIKKLLALSKNPNENEAKSALAKANELMQKYETSLEEVTSYEIPGYFVWLRTPKGPTYQKWDKDAFSMFPDSRKRQEAAQIKRYPLSRREFERATLQELVEKYPLPANSEAGVGMVTLPS